MAGWQDRSLLDLLAEHGLDMSPEHEFPNDGWSGATFTSLEDASGRRYVLKRTSLRQDWIARATLDHELREGWFASIGAAALGWLPRAAMPYLGAAADGDGVAILSPDLSNELIAWERPGHDPIIDGETLRRVLQAIARLHAVPWSHTLESTQERDGKPPPPWCPLAERVFLLAPGSATRYQAEGDPVGDRFVTGWGAFRRHAPASAWDLVEHIESDQGPLMQALQVLPWLGLHGDLKLANVALLPDGAVGFIDWQMTMRAPVAVELGWFLVSNSDSLAATPDAVLRTYRDALEWDSGRWGFGDEPPDLTGLAGDWDLQRDLVWIIGLLLRGWRKGLDAEAGVTLPSGVTAGDDLAWWCRQAVEAAARRL
jgi:hypothetical protein